MGGGLLLVVLVPLLTVMAWELLRCFLPVRLGRLFSWTLRVALGDTAPVVDIKSISVKFWYRRQKIHALLTVEGFGFGNPPDFPHKYFAAAEELSVHIAVSFKDLMALFWHTWSILKLGKSPLPMSPALLSCPIKFPWDPTAQEKNGKFRVHWKDYYVGIVHVYHLVIIGAMCNFEIGPGGELSVNGIERTLAESYCRKTWRRQSIPESKRPNRLSVSIVKAKNLRLVKRKNSAKRGDPFVSVRAREQECFTKVLMSESNPRWDESFDLHVKDPSTVLTVNVWDEDAFTSPLIGRWVMTTRFLVGNPYNCNHIKGDFKVTRRWDGDKPGTRIEGWFPLVDEDYKNMGKVGEIYMNIEWYHDAEFDRGYTPSPRPDAMGQLMLNAEENDYRGNDPDGDLLAWKAFPLLFNIRMVVIHEVAFFIKDIFAGYKGFKSMDIKNAIRMPHIYLSQTQLEPNDNFPGQTLWGAMNVIIMGGAVPQCLANSEFRNSVAWSVLSGTLRGFGQANKWKRRRDVLSRTGDSTAGNETFTQKLNRKWQLMTKGDKFLTKQVTAEDEDATKEVTLVGHLEKTSKPPHIPNVFRNWHTVKCEIKGSTLYYYPFMEDKEIIHGTARHVKLHTLQFSELIEDGGELKITSFDARAPKRYFRIPTSLPELTKNEPGLSVWCDKFKQAGVENEVKRNKEQFGSQPELFNAGVGSSPEKIGSGDATDLSGYEVEDEKFDLDEGISSGPDLLEMDEKGRNSDPFPFKKFASKREKKWKEESDRTRRRFSSMNHLTFTSRGEAEADTMAEEFEESDGDGFGDDTFGDDDTEDEELLKFYEEEYGRKSSSIQGPRSPSSFFRDEEAFDDIKASQADYLFGAPAMPNLGRAHSENSQGGNPSSNILRRSGSIDDSESRDSMNLSMNIKNRDSMNQSMNIRNDREGSAPEGDEGIGGWGFAAGLHRVQKNVQKSAKGVVKGMRRRSSTTG